MIEVVALLVILTISYLLGVVGVVAPLKLAGVEVPLTNHTSLLIWVLPLISVNVIEYLTRLWSNTPGAAGLGSLTVVVPMFLAGLVAGVSLSVAQRLFEPFDHTLTRHSEELTSWVAVALACTVITVALWRYWPEPTPKLF